MIIIVDPGHGGDDPGAVGNGLLEKDLNLSLANALVVTLEMLGHKPLLTRQDDTTWSLHERIAAANAVEGASCFISLHHDANDKPTAHGATVFYHINKPSDGDLAFAIHENMQEVFDRGMKDRGIGAANYAVLRETNIPAVLIEGGFVTNAEDAAKIQTEAYQFGLAQCIAVGIDEWGTACASAS